MNKFDYIIINILKLHQEPVSVHPSPASNHVYKDVIVLKLWKNGSSTFLATYLASPADRLIDNRNCLIASCVNVPDDDKTLTFPQHNNQLHRMEPFFKHLSGTSTTTETIGNVSLEISPSSRTWESLQSGSPLLPKVAISPTSVTGFMVRLFPAISLKARLVGSR